MSGAVWRKSTRSNSSGGECVEVAANLRDRVLVRDSKDPRGGTLAFRPAAWTAFVAEPPSSKIE
ncbi:DUF397 domain-containing protein [Solwaraspora sp. WMMD1047]|jgi:hypothetical protein|uniref:DUF397 domain-containing protein n=1 Tax=Solwaraspora sp. WMMD1047 TaxID=3016102 RepID=UPI002415FACE|nr:DUF397 domain-containing protein [Solwaraspora sp. WMMD1047]MDG4831410.1 DUF397 domain-containing protein [Solwaraspora sp. WMMD1047]